MRTVGEPFLSARHPGRWMSSDFYLRLMFDAHAPDNCGGGAMPGLTENRGTLDASSKETWQLEFGES
jgi:hypothetical protein